MEQEATPYAVRTYRSRNFLRRLAHQSRYALGLRLVSQHCPPRGSVLDYGCGDGHFLNLLPTTMHRVGYDPMPNKALVTSIEIHRDAAEIPGPFDCITCFEVMEHLTDAEQDKVFADAKALLKTGGAIIYSVPVMIGIGGFVKSIPESISGKPGYTIGNSLRCLVGAKVSPRPLDKTGLLQHMGFDHRVFRRRLEDLYRVDQIASPFPRLPSGLNSQVLFVCRI